VVVSLFTPAPRREQWAPFFAEQIATEKDAVVK
jgi:hypothetical protein